MALNWVRVARQGYVASHWEAKHETGSFSIWQGRESPSGKYFAVLIPSHQRHPDIAAAKAAAELQMKKA